MFAERSKLAKDKHPSGRVFVRDRSCPLVDGHEIRWRMDRKKWGLGKGNIGKAKSREIERIKEMSGKLRWAWTWSYWDDTEKFNAHVLMEIATPFPWEHDQVAPVDQPINAAGRPIEKLLQEHFNDINPLLLKIVHAHPVSFIFHAVGVKTLDHIPKSWFGRSMVALPEGVYHRSSHAGCQLWARPPKSRRDIRICSIGGPDVRLRRNDP